MKVCENVLLAPFTTLGVGGEARLFATAESEEDVVEAFEFAGSCGLDVFVLGGGSNVVISDAGFSGLVVLISIAGVSIETPDGARACVRAGAGESWDDLVQRTVDEDLAGFECLSGIPGRVGGTPIQNVGAYGQDVSETITSVRCYDRQAKKIVQLSNADCCFSYRRSIFNSVERGRYVVLVVEYGLTVNGPPKIAYRDLENIFRDREATLSATREAVLAIRRSKSMVIDKSDPNSQSVGSFFKNPIVDAEFFERLQASNEPNEIPYFPAGDKIKIPAAWLIEQAGFVKGFRLGRAAISSRHPLAIVNLGGAKTSDILRLKDVVQKGVSDKFNILLEPEPVFIGV